MSSLVAIVYLFFNMLIGILTLSSDYLRLLHDSLIRTLNEREREKETNGMNSDQRASNYSVVE